MRTSAQRAADIRRRVEANKRKQQRGKVKHFHDLSEFLPRPKTDENRPL